MKEYKNEKWLREQVYKYKTLSELVNGTGYPKTTLKRWCDKFGITLDVKRQSTDRVTKEFLIEQYLQGKEIRQIAKEFNLSTQTIIVKNKEFGISATDYNPKYIYKNKEWLEKQFELYGTVTNIAKETGYPRTCISRSAQRYGLYEKMYTREKSNYIDENYFSMIDSPVKAYFLGLIMADGNMYKNANNKFQFSLKLKQSDEDIVLKFSEEIGFPKDKIVYGESKRKDTICKYVSLKSYNKVFCENLIKHGIIIKKSGKESIPKDIPEQYIKDFIRGYIDGDGWVSINDKNKCIGVCSESKEIIYDIVNYFSNIITITTQIRKNKTVYSFRVSKKQDIAKICDHLYYKGCIALDRKYNNARKIVQEYLI